MDITIHYSLAEEGITSAIWVLQVRKVNKFHMLHYVCVSVLNAMTLNCSTRHMGLPPCNVWHGVKDPITPLVAMVCTPVCWFYIVVTHSYWLKPGHVTSLSYTS